MKIVFFGTPDYVVSILDLIHKRFKDKVSESGIVSVVTQKPKLAGRDQKKTYSPVDNWAYKKDIPVIYDLNQVPSSDLGILAAYGEIVPEPTIKNFKFGILNIHPSLLPKYRGASPIQAALASGDTVCGVTIIKIDQIADHGSIVTQFKEDILESDTLASLREKLFARSAEVLAALIPPYIQEKIRLRDQDHSKATFTTLVKKEHGFIPPKYLTACLQGRSLKADWEIAFIKDLSLKSTPVNLYNLIRSLDPWPGVWTNIMVNGQGSTVKRLKILKAHLEKPLAISRQPLVIDLVQLEGKSPVSWEEFNRGYPKAALE